MRNGGDGTEDHTHLSQPVAVYFRRRRATDQRPIETRLFADLQIRALAAAVGNLHAQDEIDRPQRMMRGHFLPRFLVEVGNRHRYILPAATNDDGRIQRRERDREVGDDGADARVTGEQAVILVLAIPGITRVAAFFRTTNVAMPVVPAARMLREVAADGGDISNLRR